VFTDGGQVHWLKVHEIPELGPAAKGKAIVNLLQLDTDENVATTVPVREFTDDRFLVFATERGVIKKTELSAYSNPRAGGIIGINIDEDDRLLSVRITGGDRHILLATESGQSIRFEESDVRSMGRATRGVKGISLRDDDRVVAMAVLDEEGDIFTLSARGYGKRTALDDYRVQRRGGMGIINLKVSDKTGGVVGVKQVQEGDELIMITREGKIIRTPVEGVRTIGRATQGVKIMDLESSDRIVALARVTEDDEEGLDDDGPDGGDQSGEGGDGPDEVVH